MYLCNHTALALGLEGTPDPSLKVVQDAVTKHKYTGYVCPEYVAPTPPAQAGTGGADPAAAPTGGGGGGGGATTPSAKAARR